jgi:hypothetical protein
MTSKAATWILVLGGLAWGVQSASVRATGSLNARQAWAKSLDNDEAGIWWFAAGMENTTLVVQLSPPSSDTAGCDSVIATLLVRQDFLRDAYYNHGFRQIQCQIMNEDGHTTGDIVRDIVPPDPASPLPRPVPQRHAAKVVEASA